MEKEKDRHEKELDSLKKEIMALKIMKSNYEEILNYHKSIPQQNSLSKSEEISDEVKFELFKKFADNLFKSFQTIVKPNSFVELSGSLFHWIEQMCSVNVIINNYYYNHVKK